MANAAIGLFPFFSAENAGMLHVHVHWHFLTLICGRLFLDAWQPTRVLCFQLLEPYVEQENFL